MECKSARMLAEMRGPHGTEIDADDEIALQQHLTVCPACAAWVHRESQFEANVAKAMVAIPVPAGLKARILENLVHERASWYRRRFWQTAAAAAVILVAVGLSVNWQSNKKHELSVAEIQRDTDQRSMNQREAAEAWLAREGIAFHQPIPFDYRMLLSYGHQELVAGKMVPSLTFVNFARGVHAKVFIVRGDQFNPEKLREDTYSCQLSGYQVDVREDPRVPHQWYVIVYNGADLRAFESSAQSA